MDSILEIIGERLPALTKKQRCIAEYMRDHPLEMCFTTLKELSAEVGVSEITVLNLCPELGCGSFNELKNQFRIVTKRPGPDVLSRQLGYGVPQIPEGMTASGDDVLESVIASENANIRSLFEGMDLAGIRAAAEMICRAKRVVLGGRGVSLQLIDYLLTRLIINEIPCVRVNTELYDDMNNAFVLLDPGTLLIAVSFPDYYYLTGRLVTYARERQVPILGITDSRESDIVPLCTEVLCAPSKSRLFMNSLTAPVILSNILTSAVTALKNRREDKGTELPEGGNGF